MPLQKADDNIQKITLYRAFVINNLYFLYVQLTFFYIFTLIWHY